MSMMVVSDHEFEAEMLRMNDALYNKKEDSSNNNKDNVIQMAPKGRGNNNGVPSSVRAFVANELNEGAKTQDVIDLIPVSPSSASAYKVGAHSTSSYNIPDEQLKHVVDDTKKRVSKRAMGALEQALDGITPDKIAAAKLRDVATVAQAMSAIVKNMEPEHNGDMNVQNNTIYYVPAMRTEESFEVLHVDE